MALIETTGMFEQGSLDDVAPQQNKIDIMLSSLLGVPLEVIFLEIDDKPLLTTAEALCFLKARKLAQEIGALLHLSEKMLMQRRCHHFIGKRLMKSKNPMLQSVRIILAIFDSERPPAFRGIQANLSRLVRTLASCSSSSRQSAEQNWTFSESLVGTRDASLNGQDDLAQGKKTLAEVEEEFSRRIDDLVGMASERPRTDERIKNNTADGFKQETRRNLFGKGSGYDESMTTFCRRKFFTKSRLTATKTTMGSKALAAMHIYTQPEEEENISSDIKDSTEPDYEESQNSFRKKSSAAHALTTLARSKNDHETT